MLLDELFITEQEEDAAIIFGRFNPPHQGHVAAWKEAAKFPIWYVGTNQSTIGPKDPLPFEVKIKAMETLYPEIKGHLVAEQSWFTLAAMVYKKHGAVTLRIVTDEADSATYVKMLQGSNGKEGKHGFYEFADIVWQPAPRLSSATDLRAAVAANDPKAFAKAAGVASDTKIDGISFFKLVKHYLDAQAKPVKEGDLEANSEDPVIVVSDAGGKILDKLNLSVAAQKYGLGNPGTIKQQLAHQAFTKIKNYTISAPMAGQPLKEMGGVGVVANNAKQAKDPRYVMSMTNDVKPGETQRQARKMGFKLSNKGIPPSLR